MEQNKIGHKMMTDEEKELSHKRHKEELPKKEKQREEQVIFEFLPQQEDRQYRMVFRDGKGQFYMIDKRAQLWAGEWLARSSTEEYAQASISRGSS